MLTLDARGCVFVSAERSERTQEGTQYIVYTFIIIIIYTLPVKLLTRVILFQLTTEILRVALTETAAAAAGTVRINTDAIIVIIVIITVINRRPSFLQLVIVLLVIAVPHTQRYYVYYKSIQR